MEFCTYEKKGHVAYVTITRFLSAGRGYRDRAPSETRFKRERERRVFPLWAEREPR